MKKALGSLFMVAGLFSVGRSVYSLFVPVPFWAVGIMTFSAGLTGLIGIIAVIVGLLIFSAAWPRGREKIKKVPTVLVAMVAMVMFAAAAGAGMCSGWTVDRYEAQDIEAIVTSILPHAEFNFFNTENGTVLRIRDITTNTDRHVDILISVAGRTSIHGQIGQYGRAFEKKIYDIQSAIQKIFDRSAQQSLGPGPK